ncbi:polyisoprenoid-binding protein [Sinomonas atrocyanea]|uniref:Polyisoprenoid-binding protein n=1 Tax=Sinomonas atrocyanea TaxID=37927 RepID=A0A127A3H9_9MICC|nr:YceI family protein [Sinomonas atrocyanea]AMM34018.1 polyisoprenoid-binding protein [Sinomonas atrocyanea]GEB65572.1 polyisoprenoid-binding protein [Sinomonas atrocyanea]GGG78133.1 polyisoprenoid-binding protein [Sinomonas atrocyanea]
MPELDSSLAGEWRIDPAHTRLGFSTRHAMVTKVRGAFNDVDGVINVDVDEPTNSSVSVTIKVASIDTRNAQRDEHLRTNDFFDAPHYPEITFVSKRIDQVEENSFIVNGDLTIRGVTKEIAVPIEFIGIETDPFGNMRAGFEGSRRIDRKDFGVNWNAALDSGGVLVSDRILLEFEISAIKSAVDAGGAEQAQAQQA